VHGGGFGQRPGEILELVPVQDQMCEERRCRGCEGLELDGQGGARGAVECVGCVEDGCGFGVDEAGGTQELG
jgi:hypothetical protein